ncbi:MAG TPA: porin [Polyangiaceae bacterium]|nr:porin [Polyangiaceae bacterium]
MRSHRWRAVVVATVALLATRRAAAQKSENVEASSPPTASAQAGEGGFELRSAGEQPDYRVRLGALLQADSRLYFDDRTKDNILLRRVRPILTGTVLGFLDFTLTPDFGGGQATLVDAYLNARVFSWLRLRVGKFKPPIGLERLQGDADLPLPERALTSNLTPSRDLGVQVWGEVAEGIVTYAAALLDGAPDNASIDQDVGGSKDVAGRLFVQPFKRAPALGTLGFGIAGTTGQRNGGPKATSLVGLRTTGQTALFTYAAPATDPTGGNTVFASGRHSRFDPQVHYYRGGLGVLGEVVWSQQEVHKAGEIAVLTQRAWHATISYVIGGTNGYKGATPEERWDPAHGHLGALEIAARYGDIRFDDGAFPLFADRPVSARGARNFGFSANWILSRQARVALGYERTRFAGGAGKEGAIENRPTENFVLTRAQLNF